MMVMNVDDKDGDGSGISNAAQEKKNTSHR